MKPRKAWCLNLINIFLVISVHRTIQHTAAGKTASRSGLAASASRIDGSNFNKNQATTSSKSKISDSTSLVNYSASVTQRLKTALFAHYDKTVIPVKNHSQNVIVHVGFTFRQILDLDEKNQILKSLLWSRSSWMDEHLKWNPKDYEGLDELEVPHTLVWRPDIVIYEEIGDKDYSPRLPYVNIKSTGMVSYREPCAYHTSCAIDTAFFPFDVQVCFMTYVSWTQPVTHIDLVSDRESSRLLKDAKEYFINTGEWKFVHISARKKIKNFVDLMLEERNETDHGDIWMSSTASSNYTSLGNVTITNSMFAEVSFTIVVRRNSSLYMQSMLFPSILLTTVALLGFYLPPDSGERIGLQITILLTFMVFLLAVGEMFPASTGPYLGVYFVICMGLLGINLLMTVIVLHVHFKPVVREDNVWRRKGKKKAWRVKCRGLLRCRELSEDELMRKRKSRRKELSYRTQSAVPRHTRRILQFCDRYWSVGELGARWMRTISDDELDDVISDDEMGDDVIDESETSDEESWGDSRDDKSENSREITKISGRQNRPSVIIDNVLLKSAESEPSLNNGYDGEKRRVLPNQLPNEGIGITAGSKMKTLSPNVRNRAATEPSNLRRSDSDGYKHNEVTGQVTTSSAGKPDLGSGQASRNGSIVSNILRNRVLGVVGDMRGYLKKTEETRMRKRKSRKRRKRERREKRKEEEQERQDLEQEEWKSVARAIDVIFFRIYVIFIVISHIGLLGAALHTWMANEDYTS